MILSDLALLLMCLTVVAFIYFCEMEMRGGGERRGARRPLASFLWRMKRMSSSYNLVGCRSCKYKNNVFCI